MPGAGEPSLIDLDAWDGLVFSTRGAYWKLSGAFGRLHAWMDTHAVATVGPAVGLFYDDPDVTPPDDCRYSICYALPVDEFARIGDVLAAETAAGNRAATAAPPAPIPTPVGNATPDASVLLPHDTIEVRHFPAESVAAVEYEGPAADSPALYALLASWVSARGLVPRGAPRERYVAEPGTLGGGRMHARVEQPVIRPG